jgi:hypothetical protein
LVERPNARVRLWADKKTSNPEFVAGYKHGRVVEEEEEERQDAQKRERNRREIAELLLKCDPFLCERASRRRRRQIGPLFCCWLRYLKCRFLTLLLPLGQVQQGVLDFGFGGGGNYKVVGHECWYGIPRLEWFYDRKFFKGLCR